MSIVSIVGGIPFDCLEMSWGFSDGFKEIVRFQNNAPDQTVTISKRQLFALLSVISMSCPNSLSRVNNPNNQIGSWLNGFNNGKSNDDDYFLTTQENSGQKEDLNHPS